MPSTPPMTLVLKTTVHPHNSPPAKAEPMAVPLKDGERVSILFGRMRPHLPDDDDDNDEEVRTDEGLCLPAAGRNKEAEEEEEPRKKQKNKHRRTPSRRKKRPQDRKSHDVGPRRREGQ
mmetsp:Transcript_3630/g.8222  ORF Transcript_3630/g.8222 Transcript_3630/m.8222 type:complete len:119 (+) Transcript_3630:1289-1645(+)